MQAREKRNQLIQCPLYLNNDKMTKSVLISQSCSIYSGRDIKNPPSLLHSPINSQGCVSFGRVRERQFIKVCVRVY